MPLKLVGWLVGGELSHDFDRSGERNPRRTIAETQMMDQRLWQLNRDKKCSPESRSRFRDASHNGIIVINQRRRSEWLSRACASSDYVEPFRGILLIRPNGRHCQSINDSVIVVFQPGTPSIGFCFPRGKTNASERNKFHKCHFDPLTDGLRGWLRLKLSNL